MKPATLLLTALFAAGCSRRTSPVRPPDLVIAQLAAPTPARLWVGSARRDITVPWSQSLYLEVRGNAIVAEGSSGSPPTAPFADALTEDATGDRIAYRTGPQAPWRVVYVAPAALWLSCAPPLPGAAVDWSRVPDLLTAAPAIATCHGVSFAPLAEEVRRRGGVERLAALLDATLTRAVVTEPWEAAFRTLPPALQAPLRARAAMALTREPPTLGTPFDRFARLADVDAVPLDVARLEVIARFCQPGPGLAGCRALFRRLARLAPDTAADFACDAVVSRDLNPLESAALARATRPCEPFRARHQGSQCGAFRSAGLSCGEGASSHPCTRAEYLRLVDGELAPGGAQENPSGGYYAYTDRLLAAAAMQQGVACAPHVDAGTSPTGAPSPTNR